MSLSGEGPLPVDYIVDVNWDCNLKCPMCVKRTLKKPYGQRPLDDFMTIVNKLPWARTVWLGALGDPFCYKELDGAIEFLEDKKINSPVTSNATLLTEENMKRLAPQSVIHVSIDGGTEEDYKKIRNYSLEKVKENLFKLKQKRPDVRITVNCLLFKHNIEYLKHLVQFCSILGAGIVFFFPMYFKKELEEEMNIFRLENFKDKLIELLKYSHYCGIQTNITNPNTERPCGRAFSQPIIAYDGTVYPCDYVYQNMNDYKSWTHWHLGKGYKVPQQNYAMGNIYKDDFISMWNGEKWKMLRKQLLKLNAEGTGKTFEETLKETDITKDFNHCRVCLARWGKCL